MLSTISQKGIKGFVFYYTGFLGNCFKIGGLFPPKFEDWNATISFPILYHTLFADKVSVVDGADIILVKVIVDLNCHYPSIHDG
jgi:hypothetical protein